LAVGASFKKPNGLKMRKGIITQFREKRTGERSWFESRVPKRHEKKMVLPPGGETTQDEWENLKGVISRGKEN